MPKPVEVLFLGTCSGGGPTPTRNCSSLVLSYENRACLVDCADGTLMQLLKFGFKLKKIDTILITHMHGDHVLGLAPLLSRLLTGVTNTPEKLARFKARPAGSKPAINIYGPSSLRLLLRHTLNFTSSHLGDFYAVHELLRQGDPVASCEVNDLHLNELPGRNLYLEDSPEYPGAAPCWKDVLEETSVKASKKGGWKVEAGEIEHRVTSLAYSLTFPSTAYPLPPSYPEKLSSHALSPSLLGRLLSTGEPIILPDGETLIHPGWDPGFKIAVLGDTNDASGSRKICDGADLLIHECTNAFIPSSLAPTSTTPPPPEHPCVSTDSPSTTHDASSKKTSKSSSGPKMGMRSDTAESVRMKSQARGHSTPLEAGRFAAEIRAKNVVLNHFSAMFGHPWQMREIERQTQEVIMDGRRDHLQNQAALFHQGLKSIDSGSEDGKDGSGVGKDRKRGEESKVRVVCADDGMRVILGSDGMEVFGHEDP